MKGAPVEDWGKCLQRGEPKVSPSPNLRLGPLYQHKMPEEYRRRNSAN